jgi:hypothetical protein
MQRWRPAWQSPTPRQCTRRKPTVKKAFVLLAAALLAVNVSARQAHAQFAVCYGDPKVQLSGGGTVDLSLTINTDASSVTGAQYVLHVPLGVTATSITYDNPMPFPETLTLQQGPVPLGASTYYANFYFSTTAGVTGTGSLAFNGAAPTAPNIVSGVANSWFTTYYSGQPRQ